MNSSRQALFLLVTLSSISAPAEVILDGTLGTSGSLTGPDYEITQELGQAVGDNLFHSFDTFNIDTGESATFSGAASIENVIARVSGGESSWIDGTLGSTIEGADLWLINPAGVVFGEHARLDLGGSFYVSTADYLKLGEGGSFAATVPAESVLVSAAPEAFGFLGESPAGITLEGSVLEVAGGETLALVGGDLALADVTLYAPGGTLELVSVAAPGSVGLAASGMEVTGVSAFGTITITNADGAWETVNGYSVANLDVSDYSGSTSGGEVYIRSGELTLEESRIYSRTINEVAVDGGGIDIATTGGVWLTGSRIYTYSSGSGASGAITLSVGELALDSTSYIYTRNAGEGDSGAILVASGGAVSLEESRIYTYADGGGTSGAIILSVGELALDSASYIYTSNAGEGSSGAILVASGDAVSLEDSLIYTYAYEGWQSGDITLEVNELSLDGSYLYTYNNGSGQSGDITLEVNELSLDGSYLYAYNAGDGSSGAIMLTATGGVELAGSQLFTKAAGSGTIGDITLEAGSLELTATSYLVSENVGTGASGSLQVTVDGAVMVAESYIYTTATGGGDTGNITLAAGTLELLGGGRISTSTYGAGNSGNITIVLDDGLLISGEDSEGVISGIFAVVSEGATGSGGDIFITTTKLELLDGSQILASTWGEGDGGTITINAADSITISGENSAGTISSGVFAHVESGAIGNGGDILITTGGLEVLDGAYISATTRGAGAGGTITITAADSITISGDNLAGTWGSGVFAVADWGATGNAGDIFIATGGLELLDGAQIGDYTHGEGDSGDVTINAADLITISGENTTGVISSGVFADVASGGIGNGGDIFITTGGLELLDGALVSASTWGEGDGGTITITAADSITISNEDSKGFVGGVFAAATVGSTGGSGDIFITTGDLELLDGAQISTSTWGEGDGGTITITAADSIAISGASGILASVDADATGSGGDIFITTGGLELLDGSQIGVFTQGDGDGGTITINATDSISASNGSIFASVEADATGSGGDIFITTGDLELLNGSQIGVSTLGDGDGGTVTITAADSITISCEDFQGFYSGVFATVEESATGNGGEIFITTGSLELLDGSEIIASTHGEGDGGTITITAADSVMISGGVSGSEISVSVEAGATGSGGDILITTGELTLLNGGAINASTWATGSGGTITINATDAVTVSASGINAATYKSNNGGIGGDIWITTSQLFLVDAGIISAISTGSGDGGSVVIVADDSIRLQNGSIITETVSANGGDITLTASSSLILEHGSITTSVAGGTGSGGNITIDPEFVVLYQSEIIANALEGSGGNITIVADNFIADPSSVISASSELGVDGNIEIDSPNVDVSGGLLVLANQGLDVEHTLAARCANRRTFDDEEPSSFKLVSGGGVAISGSELLPAWAVGSTTGAPGMSGVTSNGASQLPEECWQLTRLERQGK